MSNIKNPPIFHPEEDDDYLSWKNDISIWKSYTDLAENKLGAAIYLSLKGKARQVVRDLNPEHIGRAGGFELILGKLDSVFLQDEATLAYCAFKDFYEYKRSVGDNFSQFIVEHEQKYQKLIKYKMELPEGVRAFFLLKSANLTEESEKLARATAELNYEDMRDKVMKIFGDPGVLTERDRVPEVKEEVLYGYNSSKRAASRGYYRGPGRGYALSRSGQAEQEGYKNYPTGRRVMRCFCCQSIKHLIRDCPHKQNSEDVHMSVHVTLFGSNSFQSKLVRESLGKALLDSGCSKTVAGTVWVEEFIKTLSPDELRKVREVPGRSVFRFGDGVEAKSCKCMTLPFFIGGFKMLMDVEVVQSEIPLLISKGAMKQMGISLDFQKDIMKLNGRNIKLQCTSTGHYCVPVAKTSLDSPNVNVVLHFSLDGLSIKKKKEKAIKLHKQFSHAKKDRLLKLLKDSGCEDREFKQIVKEVCDECTLCQKYSRAPLRPIVSLPLASRFNECVCMDLKEIKVQSPKRWILHLIDAATRYSAACVINSKRKEVIVSQIFRIWITYFGAPQKVFSDNGGEFVNQVMTEMNEKLGVETVTTAAESPFSNGIVERHNAILYETMSKTLDDVKCEQELALAWAVSAKNALQNQGGTHQIN